MFEWCSITEITTSSPGISRADRVLAARLSASDAFLVKTTSSGGGGADEGSDQVPGPLVCLGGLGTEHVHRARHVGVVPQVVLGDRVNATRGFWEVLAESR